MTYVVGALLLIGLVMLLPGALTVLAFRALATGPNGTASPERRRWIVLAAVSVLTLAWFGSWAQTFIHWAFNVIDAGTIWLLAPPVLGALITGAVWVLTYWSQRRRAPRWASYLATRRATKTLLVYSLPLCCLGLLVVASNPI